MSNQHEILRMLDLLAQERKSRSLRLKNLSKRRQSLREVLNEVQNANRYNQLDHLTKSQLNQFSYRERKDERAYLNAKRELEKLRKREIVVKMPYAEIDTSQYYIGFRAFSLMNNIPKLYSSSMGVMRGAAESYTDWHPGDCIAKCRRLPHFVQDREMRAVQDHEAPKLTCHCGFYGCHSIAAVRTHTSGKLFAAIQQWGKCIEHKDGIRSQYARVIGFHYIREIIEGRTAVNEDWVCMHSHTDCPVCGSLEERVKGNIVKQAPLPDNIVTLQQLYNIPLFEKIADLETYASEFGQVIKFNDG